MNYFRLFACAGAVTLLAFAQKSLADAPTYAVSKTIHIGGEGSWDYITCDSQTHRLFFPRQTHTQIVDAATGQVVGDIPDTQGSHGVALAPDANRGFVSDRNGVTVFDLKTLKPLGTIAAGTGADSIIYDPASKCVVVMNGRSKNASFIDAAADIATAKATNVELDGRPEFAAADGKGKVFINLEDKNEVAVLDSADKKVIATWKIDGGDGPSGMTIDPEKHHLFSGCHNKVMAILDTETGKTIATVPIGSGVDACAFDPGTGTAFASCGDGTVTAITETSPGKFAATTIQTRPAARTMTLDTSTHTLYLPDAEMEPTTQPAAGGGGGRRGRMKPDSFMLIVVSPSETGKQQ